MFSFVAPDGPRLFVDSGGRTMERGYRFTGEPPTGLSARQNDTKKLFDVFNIAGFMCVSLRVKEMIEALGQGAHQFFSIRLLAKNGHAYAEDYYIFNPCDVVDAYLGVADVAGWMEPEGTREPYISGFLNGTVSAPEIGGRHVWVGGFLGRSQLHVSDTLNKTLGEAKVRYLTSRPLDESDAIWRPDEQMPKVMRWLDEDPARIRDLTEKRPDWVRRHRPQWLQ